MFDILWTLLVFAMTWAAWMPFYRTPLYQDQSLHFYIGRQWLKGKIPYRDYSLALGPHLVAMYAIFSIICGKNEVWINFLSATYIAFGNLLLFWTVKGLYGSAAAVFASLFFAFYIFSPRLIGDRLPPESYATPPIIAAYSFLITALGETSPVSSFAAGFFLGVAAMFRQSAYFYIVPCFMILYLFTSIMETFLAIAGFVLIHLLWLGYFAAHGALKDYLRSSIWYAISIAFFGNVKGPGQDKSDPMRASMQRMFQLIKINSLTILPLYLLSAAGMIYMTIFRADLYIMATGFFFLTGIVLIFPRWNFDCCYWLNSLPWASILGGVTCGLLIERMFTDFTIDHMVILTFTLGFLFYLFLFDYSLYGTLDPEKRNAFFDPQKMSHASWWTTYEKIGRYLYENTKESDKILVLGHAARILNAADRDAFFYAPSFVLFKMKPFDVEECKRFKKAITIDYPDVIVLAGHMPAYPFNPQPYLKDLEEISNSTGIIYVEMKVIEGFPIYMADREKSYLNAVLKGCFNNKRLKTEREMVSPETHKFEDNLQRGNKRDSLSQYLDALVRAERYDDAIFAIRTVLDLKAFAPDPVFLHNLLIILGEMLYNKGAVADAEKTFQGILGMFPRSSQALNHLGAIRFTEGNHDEARKFFCRAIDADPQNEDALANLEVLSAL